MAIKSEKETVYNITSKDKKEMKNICNFGFHEKDGSPHVCKVNCECEFATFGICNDDAFIANVSLSNIPSEMLIL